MTNPGSRGDSTIVPLRLTDLRATFGAQLRAIARLEEQFRKAKDGIEHARCDLASALRRKLAEMLANNANIRTVLSDLAIEAESIAQT
jgi:hypothetical protein